MNGFKEMCRKEPAVMYLDISYVSSSMCRYIQIINQTHIHCAMNQLYTYRILSLPVKVQVFTCVYFLQSLSGVGKVWNIFYFSIYWE